jgi:hypothetical protein
MSLRNTIGNPECMYHPLAMMHSVVILVGNEMFKLTMIVAVAVLRPCSSDTVHYSFLPSSRYSDIGLLRRLCEDQDLWGPFSTC